jgi:hypothetical protein
VPLKSWFLNMVGPWEAGMTWDVTEYSGYGWIESLGRCQQRSADEKPVWRGTSQGTADMNGCSLWDDVSKGIMDTALCTCIVSNSCRSASFGMVARGWRKHAPESHLTWQELSQHIRNVWRIFAGKFDERRGLRRSKRKLNIILQEVLGRTNLLSFHKTRTA